MHQQLLLIQKLGAKWRCGIFLMLPTHTMQIPEKTINGVVFSMFSKMLEFGFELLDGVLFK